VSKANAWQRQQVGVVTYTSGSVAGSGAAAVSPPAVSSAVSSSSAMSSSSASHDEGTKPLVPSSDDTCHHSSFSTSRSVTRAPAPRLSWLSS
jgi:hypothetical protein